MPDNCIGCEHGIRDGELFKRNGRLDTMAAFCMARKIPWLLQKWRKPPEYIKPPKECPLKKEEKNADAD